VCAAGGAVDGLWHGTIHNNHCQQCVSPTNQHNSTAHLDAGCRTHSNANNTANCNQCAIHANTFACATHTNPWPG
jgi:hypothetical protein